MLLVLTASASDEARIFSPCGEPHSGRLEPNIDACNATLAANVEKAANEVRLMTTQNYSRGGVCADHILVSADSRSAGPHVMTSPQVSTSTSSHRASVHWRYGVRGVITGEREPCVDRHRRRADRRPR
jgi:hypothetical protein